jgi:hypothetical protein
MMFDNQAKHLILARAKPRSLVFSFWLPFELAIDNLRMLASRVSSSLLINSVGWMFRIFYIELDSGVCQ